MTSIEILLVSIDEAGRLRVRPDLPPSDDFEFIWRTASGIRWDSAQRDLYSPASHDLSTLGWFQGIAAATRDEYGTSLMVTSRTAWANVPMDVRTDIESWASTKTA